MTKIAVIVENSSEYGRQIIDGVADYAQKERDWRLTWVSPRNFDAAMLPAGCQGVIARVVTDGMARKLRKAGLPVVDIFCARQRPNFHGVDSDHFAIGRMAAEHFLSKRHTSLAFAGFTGVPFSDLRLRGFVETLRDQGITPTVLTSVMTNDHRTFFNDQIVDVVESRPLEKWIRRLSSPTALFAANDLMALQVSRLAEKNGIRIPADLLVLGVDDDRQLCAFAGTPMSSIDPNAFEVGRSAARILSAAIRDPPEKKLHPIYRVRPKSLVERASTQHHGISPEWLADALGFIDASLDRPLSTFDIVEHAGLSHVAVGKMFQKKLGMSPQKYITKLKMDAARQMLENDGSLRVKEVAVRLGFSSLAYFCNVYRQYWGRSPRD